MHIEDLGLTQQDLRWAQHRDNVWRESPDASLLLLIAAASGLPRPRLVGVFLELTRARIALGSPAARALLQATDRYLAGTATLAELEAADAALSAEPRPRGYDYGAACAAETASQIIQNHPPEPLAAGWWFSDGLTESLTAEQLAAGADVVRLRISEGELQPIARAA